MQNASFKKSISDSIKEVEAGSWIFCTRLKCVLSLTRAGQKSDAKDDTISTTEISRLVQLVILE